MPKRLILIRHAKSSWAEPGMLDHDRPLNRRGQRAAIAIGAWLRDTGYVPDHILCSTSARTRETCALLGLTAKTRFVPTLYHAGPETMLSQLRATTGACVALIGHNPGIATFAALVIATEPPHGRFADFPTGATLVADFDVEDWSEVQMGTGRVVNFITPRELTGE